METIKVNMTPCEDVQTIHASQNDNEAREWGFELHNNGDVIDSSEITDQIVFKAYEGGTEELLPSSSMNGFVDLGSLEWTYLNDGIFKTSAFPNVKTAYIPNWFTTADYTVAYTTNYAGWKTRNMQMGFLEGNQFIIFMNTSFTDADAFKESLSGVYLWYETTDSTPSTTPFLGNIKYPQGLLADQEFTYRESPTEEDGLAFVENIKGNTLVWNQLFNISNPAKGINTSNYQVNGSSFSFRTTSANDNYVGNIGLTQNHKYYIHATNKTSSNLHLDRYIPYSALTQLNANSSYANIVDINSSKGIIIFSNSANVDIVIENFMIVDLSLMYGIGNEPTTVDEFTSLFPLSYYAYNQGTLLSFMGNGIKTVGKNRFNKDTITPSSRISANGEIFSSNASDLSDYVDVGAYDTVTVSYDYIALVSTNTRDFCFFDSNKNYLGVASYYPTNKTFTLNVQDCHYLRITFDKNVTDIQIEGGSKTSYEPYTSSTLSLPISTYFSNGMKSAGSVYDELTESKAITRIGSVDLGSLTWEYRTTGSTYAPYFYTAFTGIKPNGNPNVRKANILCSKYSTAYRGQDVFIDKTICADGSSTELTQLQIKDSSYTDAMAFKQAMTDQNVKLYYELSTPTETSFTTASLVTENTEIPLSNEDGVLIGKCTEQLSENPGFIDAKIKLADDDGECYSNKIQLHVERKPS